MEHDASASTTDNSGHDAALIALLSARDASHTAVRSGDWSDPATWAGGRVPGADADVVVPQGIDVRYDVASNAELHYVRVDGGLNFATDVDTKLVVDTLFTTSASYLTIGTVDQPVAAGVSAEIVIADNGPIDLSADPEQLTRGVVTSGKVEIHGASKAPYLKLAEEPRAGDQTITLEGDVGSWSVGDSLVVMGTSYLGNDARGILKTEDEEVTITAIDAATGRVTLDRPLAYDHTTPDYKGRAGLDNELSVYVGNSSRNVTISSENPDGVRGHVMFRHNPDIDVRFAEFDQLGRTDKSKPINTDELWDADDSDFNGPDPSLIGTPRNPGDENPEGRYSLHIHRAGTEADAKLAILEGNAVTGSPGWGIVQHDSRAAVNYNFVYGVAGAGIVSEDANETGEWIGNFVTSTIGTDRDPTHKGDANVLSLEGSGDFGLDGVAYESQARQIVQQYNIAANSKTAWMFNTSETSTIGPDIDAIQFDPSGNPFAPRERLNEEDAPVVGFTGNEIIAVTEGVFTGHRNIDNLMDIQQQFFDLTAWNVEDSALIFFNYTNEYVVKDSLFVNVGRALKVGDKVEGINLSNVHVEDTNGRADVAELRGYNTDGVFIDVTFTDAGRPVQAYEFSQTTLVTDTDVRDGRNLTPVEIAFTPDSDARMTISNDTSRILIRGELTDSVGSFNFAANLWIRQERFAEDGIEATIGSRDHDYILDKYGAIRNADGSWDLAFFWWVGDRMTGENQAVFIPLRLEGFDAAYLEQYRIDRFTPPSGEVKLYYEDGIRTIGQDFGRTDGNQTDGNQTDGAEAPDEPAVVENAAPVFAFGRAASTAENTTSAGIVGATDADGDDLRFWIDGGADSALFRIDADTGALAFRAAPDYEAPADNDGDNVYEVGVSATDGTDAARQTVSVTVTNDTRDDETSGGDESTDGGSKDGESTGGASPDDVSTGGDDSGDGGSGGDGSARTLIAGTSDKDRLVGSGADEIFDGGAGRDVYIGNGGADIFVLGDGDSDQLRGLEADDLIDISAWGVRSFDELLITDRGALLTIQHKPSGNMAFSYSRDHSDLSARELTAKNFIFAGADDDSGTDADADSSGGDGGGGGGGGATANGDPFAVSDAAVTTVGQSVRIDVLANDGDPDGDPLSIAEFGQGAYGAVRRAADGALVYTPDDGFAGVDSVGYRISDGRGGDAEARIAFTVLDDDGGGDGSGAGPNDGAREEISLLDEPMAFDGGAALVIDHDPVFETAAGSIALRFRADDVDTRQGLFSKDSYGFDDGGHLSLHLKNGELSLRAQTRTENLQIKGGEVRADATTDVVVSWRDGELTLTLNGAEVGSVDGWTGLGPNLEPIVLGGAQIRSGDLVADRIEDVFSGDIFSAAFTTEKVGGDATAAPSAAGTSFAVLADDTDMITLNLSSLADDPGWEAGARVTAVDAKGGSGEIDFGPVTLSEQTLNLNQTSDWALTIAPL